MNEAKKNNKMFNYIRVFVSKNLKSILISIGVILIIFVSFQIYNYFIYKNIKQESVNFFNTIERSNQLIFDLEKLNNNDEIFSILSNLKIIQEYNKEKKFTNSIDLYNKILSSNKLNTLYKSAIAAHASYSLIEASYKTNTKNYINDISIFVDLISDKLESYLSIKYELKYLLIILEIDLSNSVYKNNTKAVSLFNEIFNSNEVSSTVKERVKKIHEFQLYK